MLSGAAQHHKRWPTILRKTDAMARAKRQNGNILDEIWRQETFESFQMIPSTKRVNRRTSAGRNNSVDVGKQSTNRNSCGELSNESVHLLAVDRATNFEFNNSDCFSQSLECLESAELSCAGLQAPTENKDRLLPTSTTWSIGTKTTSPSTPVGSPSSFTFLRLNIGGTFYLLLVDALLRADPNSFLAKFVYLTHSARIKVADGYLPQEDAYYFQRSPAAFESIFQYYASGVIHKPAEVCHNLLSSELDFWRIPNMYVGSCCKDEIATKKKVDEENESQVDDKAFDRMMFGKLRRRMWTFLEKPGSSLQAKSFELSSTMFVAISVIGLSFATIPEFQVTEHVFINDTSFTIPHDAVPREDGKVAVRTEHPAFIFTEWICIAFFTVEYALRYFAAPRKLKFMLKPLNLVDLLAVIPFYLELILKLSGVNDRKLWDLRWAFLVVRILRVLRVIRIIKLGRFSSGLQTFGMTLKRSQKQLQMMTIVLLTGVVFFSTMIYFLEKDESGTPFSSIPAAYWWCIVTMTTVGYGDVVPVTTMGKIIASAAIMSGVLVLALPITIIVDNFIKVAQDEQQAEQSRDVEQKSIAEKELLIRMTPA